MQIPEASSFYLLLNSVITGAEHRGLNRKELAAMLRPIVFPDDEQYDTEGAAIICHRSTSTLERWRSIGRGPVYFKDAFGCVYYTGKTLREFRELPEPINP